MKNKETESLNWQTFVPSNDYYIKGKKLNPVIIKQHTPTQTHSHTNTLFLPVSLSLLTPYMQ